MPLSNLESDLDAKLREEARAFLRELIVRLGLSALMVTHDQSEAMAISDRILLLNNGRIEQQGAPQSMDEMPDSLFTAEFMGSNNKLPAKVIRRDGDRVTLDVDGATMMGTARGGSVDGAATAVIRLEQVRISDTQADNAIRLPLSTRMYLGDAGNACSIGPTRVKADCARIRRIGCSRASTGCSCRTKNSGCSDQAEKL